MSTCWPNGSRTQRPRQTREFGFRSPIYSRGWHTGQDTVDYNNNHAIADGVVVSARYNGSYGNEVVIDHGGWFSRTAHGASFFVKVGDRVRAADGLMVQGSTGMSTGKHNHQEIILSDGSFVDPVKWISERIAKENSEGSKPTPNPQPSGGQQTINLSAGWAWYTSAADAVNERNPRGPRWTGEQLARGIYHVLSANEGGAIKIRANDGSHIFISPKARHLISGGGGTSPAPAPNRGTVPHVDLDTEWYYYDTLADARAARNPKKWVPRGKHRIDGGTGPYQIYVGALKRHVWIGSKTLPRKIEIPR